MLHSNMKAYENIKLAGKGKYIDVMVVCKTLLIQVQNLKDEGIKNNYNTMLMDHNKDVSCDINNIK